MSAEKTEKCPFCDIGPEGKFLQNEFFFATYDKFPVNMGHTLVIPKRHFPSFFDITEKEWISLREMILKVKEKLDADHKPDAYNIGINVGKDAGQSVFHLHVHVIPRYRGDIEGDPKGGIRRFKKPLVDY